MILTWVVPLWLQKLKILRSKIENFRIQPFSTFFFTFFRRACVKTYPLPYGARGYNFLTLFFFVHTGIEALNFQPPTIAKYFCFHANGSLLQIAIGPLQAPLSGTYKAISRSNVVESCFQNELLRFIESSNSQSFETPGMKK